MGSGRFERCVQKVDAFLPYMRGRGREGGKGKHKLLDADIGEFSAVNITLVYFCICVLCGLKSKQASGMQEVCMSLS